MKKDINNFDYSEKDYLDWKRLRFPEKDNSRQAYIKWRIEVEAESTLGRKRYEKARQEAKEKYNKLTPEQKIGLEAARKRHWRKTQIEEETNYVLRHRDQHQYEEKDYATWKMARAPGEDDSRKAYVIWRQEKNTK